MATPMPSPPPPVLGGNAPKKRPWLKILGIIFVAIIILVAAIITLVFSMGAAPMKSADEFLKQLSSNQVDQAYSSASIAFQQSITKDDFTAFVAKYPILAEVKSSSFNSFKIENNNFATVRGTITGTNGQVSPVAMQLVNENNAWKVMNIDLNPPAEESTFDTSNTIDDMDSY